MLQETVVSSDLYKEKAFQKDQTGQNDQCSLRSLGFGALYCNILCISM